MERVAPADPAARPAAVVSQARAAAVAAAARLRLAGRPPARAALAGRPARAVRGAAAVRAAAAERRLPAERPAAVALAAARPARAWAVVVVPEPEVVEPQAARAVAQRRRAAQVRPRARMLGAAAAPAAVEPQVALVVPSRAAAVARAGPAALPPKAGPGPRRGVPASSDGQEAAPQPSDGWLPSGSCWVTGSCVAGRAGREGSRTRTYPLRFACAHGRRAWAKSWSSPRSVVFTIGTNDVRPDHCPSTSPFRQRVESCPARGSVDGAPSTKFWRRLPWSRRLCFQYQTAGLGRPDDDLAQRRSMILLNGFLSAHGAWNRLPLLMFLLLTSGALVFSIRGRMRPIGRRQSRARYAEAPGGTGVSDAAARFQARLSGLAPRGRSACFPTVSVGIKSYR